MLFRAERAPNPQNDSSEDSEVDNRLKKIHFADLVKDAKSVFLLPANFELVGMTSHKQGLASKYSFKTATSKVKLWASFETNFSNIAGTLEAKTSVSGKTQCFLVG